MELDDPMVRLTGLSLNPNILPNNNVNEKGTVNASVQPFVSTSASTDNTAVAPAAEKESLAPSVVESSESLVAQNKAVTDSSPTPSPPTDDQDDVPFLTLRALVSSREAGIVIGRAGASVAHVREVANVKVGVSKVVPGVSERILTVTGSLSNISKAYAMICKNLLESVAANSANEVQESPSSQQCTIRLLVAHQLVGSVIGKAGAKIREIQEASGAKIVVSKDMLPQSTERVIEVIGVVDSVHIAIYHIAECVLGDLERANGVILYDPSVSSRYGHGLQQGTQRGPGNRGVGPSVNRRFPQQPSSYPRRPYQKSYSHQESDESYEQNEQELEEETPEDKRVLTVPVDLIGCIIGKGGSFINTVRRTSGARLHIDEFEDGMTERTVTISGSTHATQNALGMIYHQLETEKERRLRVKKQHDEQTEEVSSAAPASEQ